ncbi:RDD family protein [Rhodococcus zopfii]|uniref:RDD family protein n=1 Tax=Rhodococcus zopfii TaxID=43772 RepID=A0ABU3WKC2_9NOCA|nr:RDD family protein [Rhodococcus zopfii]
MSEHRPAGIVTRGLAALLDLGIVLAGMGGLYLSWALMRLLFSPQQFAFPDVKVIMSVTTCSALSVLYLAACWATTGRTVGAVVMGLRVVGRDDRLVGWVRAVVRAGFCVVFPVGLIVVAVDRRRRSLQDIVLRTVVVYDWQPDPHLAEPHPGR